MSRALVAAAMLLLAACMRESPLPERALRFAALPDWTGLWETEFASDLAAGRLPPFVPREGDLPEEPFRRAMALLREPPFNTAGRAAQARYEVWWNSAAAAGAVPTTVCQLGFPTLMESPTPDGMFDAIVTPEQTVLAFRTGEVRHIHTDGRAQPAPEDVWATPLGYSIGRWEGDTLVVETIARTAGPLAPGQAWPAAQLAANVRIVERLRRVGADQLENEMTIHDEAHFEEPWTLKIRYRRVTDVDRLMLSNCTDNDRNPVVNGQFVIAPP